MNWKFKALIFKTLSVIPFGSKLHYQLQRHVQKTWPRSDETINVLCEHAKKTLEIFSKYSTTPVENAIFLEIGGGRDLVVPVALRMLGVKHLVSVDVERLANLDLVNHSAKVLADILGCERPHFDSWEALREYGVEYRAPFFLDKDRSELRYDVFMSNEVLEHIPKAQLENIISSASDFMTSEGLYIHAVDYSDHYARDCGVSRYNFLQYSVEKWKKYNSKTQFVNRLRHAETVGIFLESGLEVLEENVYSETIPAAILENLAEDFVQHSPDDLKILRSRIVAR